MSTAAPPVPLTIWCVGCHAIETQELPSTTAATIAGAEEYAPGLWSLLALCPDCGIATLGALTDPQPGLSAGLNRDD
jgi:hypothetical protein